MDYYLWSYERSFKMGNGSSITFISLIACNFKVFLTQEDCDAFGNQEDSSDAPKPTDDDEVVERVRRMHLNDLENATPFFFLGLAYAMSKVCQWR